MAILTTNVLGMEANTLVLEMKAFWTGDEVFGDGDKAIDNVHSNFSHTHR